MKKNRKGLPLIILGLILICGSFSFTIYNEEETLRAGRISREVVTQLDKIIEAEEPSTYGIFPNMEMPVIPIADKKYIGTLSIPSLSLELPVMDSFSYVGLRISPCRYSGSAYQDNLVIAAHNYRTHFGKLKNLKAGDQIILTDADGNVFSYEVKGFEILEPEDIDGMNESSYDLTLFTCTLSGQERLAVRCNKI
jgi:sortase A